MPTIRRLTGVFTEPPSWQLPSDVGRALAPRKMSANTKLMTAAGMNVVYTVYDGSHSIDVIGRGRGFDGRSLEAVFDRFFAWVLRMPERARPRARNIRQSEVRLYDVDEHGRTVKSTACLREQINELGLPAEPVSVSDVRAYKLPSGRMRISYRVKQKIVYFPSVESPAFVPEAAAQFVAVINEEIARRNDLRPITIKKEIRND